MLKRHEGTLRGLFDFYAALGTTSYDDEQHLRDRQLMSCGEWLNFLDATGLFEMRLIPSIHAALMAFQWSRIRSLSDAQQGGDPVALDALRGLSRSSRAARDHRSDADAKSSTSRRRTTSPSFCTRCATTRLALTTTL